MGATVMDETMDLGEYPPMDPIDAAIERLGERKEEGDGTTLQNTLAAQLLAEAEAEPLRTEATKPPADIWTLESMEQMEPLTGDLYGDGTRLFTFWPKLGNEFCQTRFKRARFLEVEGPNKVTTAELQTGYVDIMEHVIDQWGVRKIVRDEAGNIVYEEDGVTPVTEPLPPTRENIEKLSYQTIMLFLDAMTRAYRGEASGQPS